MMAEAQYLRLCRRAMQQLTKKKPGSFLANFPADDNHA